MSNENKLSTAPAGAVAQKTAGGGALSVFADGASFNTALRMAQCLASSTVVPKEYHGNVGNCMIAIEMASRINTSPMMVMQNLYIVNGRPAWSSQWIIAMINSSRRYKTELQFEFGRDKADGGLSCRAWAEDYSGHKVYGPKITMNMANDEGWTSKNGSKWKTMPDVMIQYRAASFFGRMNCPDMIMGIYSQEEVLDMGELPTDGFALVVDPATGEVTEAEKDEPITQDQRQTLFKMATSAFGQEANGVMKSLLAAEGYESTEGLPTSVYHRITEKVMEMAQEKKPEPEAPQEASDTLKTRSGWCRWTALRRWSDELLRNLRPIQRRAADQRQRGRVSESPWMRQPRRLLRLGKPGAAGDQQKISGRHQKRRAGRLPRARQG